MLGLMKDNDHYQWLLANFTLQKHTANSANLRCPGKSITVDAQEMLSGRK